MNLHIYNKNLEKIGVLDGYISLVWGEDYRGGGEFKLTCYDTPQAHNLLQTGHIVARGVHPTTMVIEFSETDTIEKRITAMGYSTSKLLKDRIVYKTQKIYNAERGVYDLINNNIRGLEKQETAPLKGYREVVDTQFTGTEVFEAIEKVCQGADFGFKNIFDEVNKKHIFEVYKGRDFTEGNVAGNIPRVFKPELRNLYNIVLESDISEFKTVAHIAGEGEGAERIWTTVGAVGTEHSRELFVDARDLQREDSESQSAYIGRLKARAEEKLNEHNKKETFDGEVAPAGFGETYNLGDKVTCVAGAYGVELNVTIIGYTLVRENNITTLSIKMGEPTDLTTIGFDKVSFDNKSYTRRTFDAEKFTKYSFNYYSKQEAV